MIWHIFKKDVRLLWPLAALMAATQFVLAAIMSVIGIFNDSPEFGPLAQELPAIVMVAIAMFIAVAVHQDAPCSQNQDWLTRPIARRDLLVAKLLIVVLMVQGPMLLVDIFQGLANGFSLDVISKMAIWRSLFIASWTIPVLALASLTENLVQAIAVGIGVMVVSAGYTILFRGGVFALHFPTDHAGIAWVQNTLGHVVILFATVIVLRLQYFRRAPQIGRGIAAGAFAIFLLAHFLPWDAAFAIQTLVSPVATDANSISIAFDPSQPKYKVRFLFPHDTTAHVPLRFAGIAKDDVVYTDRVELRLLDTNGNMVAHLYPSPPPNSGLGSISGGDGPPVIPELPMTPIWNDGAGSGGNAYQNIYLRPDDYRRLRDKNLRLELRYWFTVSRLATTMSYTTASDDHYMPYLGRCATKIFNGYAAEFRCLQPALPGQDISCASAHLENLPPDAHYSAHILCYSPNYEPYPEAALPDGLHRVAFDTQYPHKVGKIYYVPIEESLLEQSRLIVGAYKPTAHVMKTLVIPNIRLSDWEAGLDEPTP